MRVGPRDAGRRRQGQADTRAGAQAHQPVDDRRGVAAACLAIIVTVGGCAALVVVGPQRGRGRDRRDAITKAQYDLIDPGTPESVVRARLGDPLSEESFNRPRVDCIYYAQRDEGLFGIDDFQFCFRDGVLDSKSSDSSFFD